MSGTMSIGFNPTIYSSKEMSNCTNAGTTPEETIMKGQKQIEDSLRSLATAGKALVKSNYVKVINEHNEVFKAANEIEEEFKNGNSFQSIDAFKNAGGEFDKNGCAYIINKETGAKEKFTGVIRLNYERNTQADKYGIPRNNEAWDTRDYAKFGEDGYLQKVAHLEYASFKVDEITYDPIDGGVRTAVISSKETEVVKRSHNPYVKNEILEKYGLK